ncbi:MAG TPA: methyltransferase domain-containing protein [Candidatus Dormibacteraeota bacterium]|nr:methyltransferase domain-containing protein [Candidatus Dormibacteraeota bacterium]
MDYAEAVAKAPPGWRHFGIHDIARLPPAIRSHEMARVPAGEPDDRVVRGLFWTLVYHLEPEKWDELARYEPIHPELIDALPDRVAMAIDVGAGSGRLTQHLARRSRRVVAVEPAAGLRAMLKRRLSEVEAVAGWAENLPVGDGLSELTAASGAFGPDPVVLGELRRVTRPGGCIALINPEQPEWFEANGWSRLTVAALPAPDHPAWIEEFFGPLDPPRELLMQTVGG